MSKYEVPQHSCKQSTSQAKVDEYLDKHRDDIKYAKKGYIKTVAEGLKNESGIELTESKLRRAIATYRTTHNCPIEYVPNKYYKPSASNGKRAYVQRTPESASEPETQSPCSALASEPEPTPAPTPAPEDEPQPSDVVSALTLLIKKINEHNTLLKDLVDAVECADLMRQKDAMRIVAELGAIDSALNEVTNGSY